MERKALILVHGMGEQERNSMLLGIVDPILELMKLRGDSSKQSDLDGDLSFTEPASVDITYGDQQWHVVEYWWATGFRPPSIGNVSKWIALRLCAHIVSMIKGLVKYGLLDVRPNAAKKQDPLIARVYKVVSIPFYILGALGLLALTPFLALLLYLLSRVRLVPGVPSIVGKIEDVLQAIGIDYLGDIYLYFTDQVQSSQIRGGLMRLTENLGVDEGCSEVFFYSHSTGAVVVYDTLAQMTQSKSAKTIEAISKVKASIATGSILNMAWNSRIVRHDRFRQPISGHIRWYDLWTQFDPGPAGPIDPNNKPWLSNVSLVDRRVNNHEDILLDHTGYSDNQEQVITLILEELGGLDSANDFWRGANEDEPDNWGIRSEQAWKDYDLRRGTLAWLALFRLPVFAVALIAFPVLLFVDEWARAIGSFLRVDWIAENYIPFAGTWIANGIGTADPSIITRLGMSVLMTLVLTALTFLLYLAYKLLIWQRLADGAKSRRHEAFKQWRRDTRS